MRKPNINFRYLLFGILLIILILMIQFLLSKTNLISDRFDPKNAMSYVEAQLSFGPRYPGSPGHQKEIDWIKDQLTRMGWQTEEQSFFYRQKKITNLIAKNSPEEKLLLIGTHFDTRQFADRDPIFENRLLPVPGANDGASGVAVLLELARMLIRDKNNSYWFLFFDAEDQGEIQGWEWIIGSTHFAQSLETKPAAVLIVDMVGDQNLNIVKDGLSDKHLQEDLWKIASNLGYSNNFDSEIKYHMIDDHKPFSDLGIPSVLLIDFEYPYWHTTADTIDKISLDNLQIVGLTILEWIKSK